MWRGKNISPQMVMVLVAGIGLGVVLGWTGRAAIWLPGNRPQALRESSKLSLINPLLLCNVNERQEFNEVKSLNDGLERLIAQEVRAGRVIVASVYFRNLNSGDWVMVHETERYSPASLVKVPLLIAYLRFAETKRGVLDERLTIPVGQNSNNSQEIRPEQVVRPGQSYSVAELLERMIQYSDNDAALALYDHLNQDSLRNVYADLGVSFPDPDARAGVDFMTVNTYGRFFRVLYNGTYLWRGFSDRALQILSKSSFTNGLVAGVPPETPVAHKFGLLTITRNGVPYQRELHDCGIVYRSNHPFLLCVMTRTNADISQAAKTIATITKFTYDFVEARPQFSFISP